MLIENAIEREIRTIYRAIVRLRIDLRFRFVVSVLDGRSKRKLCSYHWELGKLFHKNEDVSAKYAKV